MQFILNSIIARETTMVLRMTGASWLAMLMRAERGPDESARDRPWRLAGEADPEIVEALERLERGDERR